MTAIMSFTAFTIAIRVTASRSVSTKTLVNHISNHCHIRPPSLQSQRLAMSSTQEWPHHTSSASSSSNRLKNRLPPGTWDTHMHVVDPHAFPLDSGAKYKPTISHTIDDATAYLTDRLGIQKMVIVQPSIYGNDNSCTLSALRRLGPKNGRAVIQFDPDPDATSGTQLQEWHRLGVRGVRLNFKSVGASPTEAQLHESLTKYANAVGQFRWALELYIGLEHVGILEEAILSSNDDLAGINIIVDHFGHPSSGALSEAKTAQDLPGFDALIRLLRKGNVWVKLSAGYRLDHDPESPIVESLCRQLVREAPNRCVFATDWPHTRFDGLDVVPYVESVLDWIEEEGASLAQVLVTNAEELFYTK